METMTTQLQTSGTNITLAELDRTMASVERVRHAHKQPKIRDLGSREKLDMALKQCLSLCGIKTANLPSQSQWLLMLDAIEKHLNSFAPEEIKLAFEMFLAKKFTVKGLDSGLYQNFTFEVVSSVLHAYRDWRGKNNYLAGINMPKPKKLEIGELEKENLRWINFETAILIPYDVALHKGSKKIELQDPFGTLYNSIEQSGYIEPFPAETRIKAYHKARQKVLELGPGSTNIKTRQHFAQFKADDFPKLPKAEKEGNPFHTKAIVIAKKTTLITYLNHHLEQGTDLTSQWKAEHEKRVTELTKKQP